MTFWDHLDELRRVLFRVIGVWFVLAIGYFVAMPYLFDHVILAPCHNDFVFYDLLRFIGQKFDLTDEFFTQEFKVKLVNINLAAPFFIHMSTAFWMSVVTAMPYIFFEVWRFINPALYPNERKGVRKALTIGTGMFFIGVLMGYFMVYPLTLRFLSTYQLSSEVENILSLNSYIDNFMMLILCMGLAFELPLVTWLLSLLGVVNKSFLRKYRRHAVVIIVIAAAIITPTGDPFTLSVVAIPLYLLYEMSILMIKDKKEVPELEEEEEEEKTAEPHPAEEKYKANRMSEAECKELHDRLVAYVEKEKPYINPDLKMGELAAALHTSSHSLSYLLNQYLNQSYYDFINEYRVAQFKKMVEDSDYSRYTLTALAELCGFSSRASFFRSFKKSTGVTPNEYIRSIGGTAKDE